MKIFNGNLVRKKEKQLLYQHMRSVGQWQQANDEVLSVSRVKPLEVDGPINGRK